MYATPGARLLCLLASVTHALVELLAPARHTAVKIHEYYHNINGEEHYEQQR